MASSSVDFQWPTQYSFPPFFTIQPNAETRKKQLEVWSKLIRRYCKTNKMFVLEKSNNNISLFNNTRISRQLSVQSIETLLDDMNSRGEIEWVDSSVKDRCFVFWHTPSEWGKLVYNFAQENGLAKSVATLFEIANAEDQEFSGMDTAMLIRCLQTLQSEGKAEVMGEDGVKFF